MGFFIFGMLAVLWAFLGFLIHVSTERMDFQKRSLKNSIVSALATACVSVLAIFTFRACTPHDLSVWFHQNPEKAVWLTRFFEAPLAFLASLPVFWIIYRESFKKTVLLGLAILFVFLIL